VLHFAPEFRVPNQAYQEKLDRKEQCRRLTMDETRKSILYSLSVSDLKKLADFIGELKNVKQECSNVPGIVDELKGLDKDIRDLERQSKKIVEAEARERKERVEEEEREREVRERQCQSAYEQFNKCHPESDPNL
jgi:hypothetical protein